MPRPPNSPLHKAHCTQAQKEAVKLAASNACMLEGQFIRMALIDGCAAVGVDYPDDLPKRGKYKRKAADGDPANQ